RVCAWARSPASVRWATIWPCAISSGDREGAQRTRMSEPGSDHPRALEDYEAPASDEFAVSGRSAAGTVAAGIFTSRIVGFVRERAFAHFFGVGVHADVLQVAFRLPNLLQNLLGEGTISAAFIPI